MLKDVGIDSIHELDNLRAVRRKACQLSAAHKLPYRIGLLGTLEIFRTHQSTDPRDKIHGTLGLVTDVQHRNQIDVDYTKAIFEVLFDAAVSTLNQWKLGETNIFRVLGQARLY